MKILISWEAFNNDYDENGNPDPNGPTSTFHQHFFENYHFDKHILLSSRIDVNQPKRLIGRVNSLFENHKIELYQLKIKDIIDVNEIKGVIATYLNEFQDDELHFFVSPGTPAMQVCWYLLHLENPSWNTHLIQTRRARDTKDQKPEMVNIALEKSATPTTLIQRERIGNQSLQGLNNEVHIGKTIQTVYEDAIKVAQAEKINVLIQGPTGSGKEHLARYIHDQSARRSQPFITVNCSAFTDELLLSELFGHVKGAFTGANNDKKGLFESANKGTIFLDEIGDISPFTQQTLLRVIQSGEIRKVGSNETIKVNVRVISASHKDLIRLGSEEKFRWDLYYRLSTATLRLPSLDERGRVEKEEYFNFINKQVKKDLGKARLLKYTNSVRDALMSYHYPGNLREMYNIISTCYVFYNDSVDDNKHLPNLNEANYSSGSLVYSKAEEPFMRNHIIKVLQTTHANISKAAKTIGWAPNTLRDRIEKLGIDVEEFK